MKKRLIVIFLSALAINNLKAQLVPLQIASPAAYYKTGFGIEASKVILGTFDLSVEQKLVRNFALVLNGGYKLPLTNLNRGNVRNAEQYSRGGTFVSLNPRFVTYRTNDPNSELFYVGLGYGVSFTGITDDVNIKTYYNNYRTKVINKFSAQASSLRFGFIFGHTGNVRYELGFAFNSVKLNNNFLTDSTYANGQVNDAVSIPGYGSCMPLSSNGKDYVSAQLTFKVKYMVNFEKKEAR